MNREAFGLFGDAVASPKGEMRPVIESGRNGELWINLSAEEC
jgi:hypothetical protein